MWLKSKDKEKVFLALRLGTKGFKGNLMCTVSWALSNSKGHKTSWPVPKSCGGQGVICAPGKKTSIDPEEKGKGTEPWFPNCALKHPWPHNELWHPFEGNSEFQHFWTLQFQHYILLYPFPWLHVRKARFLAVIEKAVIMWKSMWNRQQGWQCSVSCQDLRNTRQAHTHSICK